MTKDALKSSVGNYQRLGKEALALVRDTIAPGQWQKLCKDERFTELLKKFKVEEN